MAPAAQQLAPLAVPFATASSSQTQHSPLQQCLLAFGFEDVSIWAAPRDPTLSTHEFVQENLVPRLSELAAAGVGPKQLEAFFRGQRDCVCDNQCHRHPLSCDLEVFMRRMRAAA